MAAPEPEGARTGVAAVVLNWRAPEMTLQAVRHALAQSRAPDRVYVVDNGSGDGSAERLAAAVPGLDDRVTLILNSENRGFGGGCNAGIGPALAAGYRYVWLLNNDAEPDENCLSALLAAAAAAPRPGGIVGSFLRDPDFSSAQHFGSWMHPVTLTCGNVETPADFARHRFAWMTAASMLVTADALAAVGGFDERFFMYWEDADLNMRVRRAGFSIVAAPDAQVSHHAGTSSATVPVQRYLWHFASQRLWLAKHHPTPGVATLLLRGKYLLKALLDRDLARFQALLLQGHHRAICSPADTLCAALPERAYGTLGQSRNIVDPE